MNINASAIGWCWVKKGIKGIIPYFLNPEVYPQKIGVQRSSEVFEGVSIAI